MIITFQRTLKTVLDKDIVLAFHSNYYVAHHQCRQADINELTMSMSFLAYLESVVLFL